MQVSAERELFRHGDDEHASGDPEADERDAPERALPLKSVAELRRERGLGQKLPVYLDGEERDQEEQAGRLNPSW